jgi:hypothetical protein
MARLEAERAFLLARAEATTYEFLAERWTGISSDALVAYAFGQAEPGCNYIGGKPGHPARHGSGSGWICSGWLGHLGPHHSGADELVDPFPSDPSGYPHDPSDLLACERTWLRLPEHLKTPKVRALLELFRAGVERNYPNANARVQGYLASDPPLQGKLAVRS